MSEKTAEKAAELEPLHKRILYVLVGSLPILVILGLCFNLIYLDYAKNNYSFFDKSIYLSNIDSHIFETHVDCGETSAHRYSASDDQFNYKKCYANEARAAAHSCFRYFNDFLVDESQADRLIRFNPNSNLRQAESGNLFSSDEVKAFLDVSDRVLNHIKSDFEIDNLYLTKPVLLTRLSTQEKASDFVYWNDQIDEVTSKPTRISGIVQLNTYVKEFLGSRFNFRNADNRTILSIQPKKGRLIAYTSGSENEYYIEKMDSGEYFFLRLSFTCDPAYELIVPRNEGLLKTQN